jgi:glycerol-3-phosphate acyltransferase PlsY
MLDLMNFAAIIGGYIFGSIPFALVIGKVFYKKDVRQFGSGNLGASNAGRVLGPVAGATVTVLDVLKAFIAMLVIWLFAKDVTAILLAGFFATIGHAFPLFANFKGGKSVATFYGFLLGTTVFLIQNVWVFVVPVALFFLMLKLFKMPSLASMTSTTVAALFSFFFVGDKYYISIALLVVAIFIIYRHKANIDRIRKGTESKISWM